MKVITGVKSLAKQVIMDNPRLYALVSYVQNSSDERLQKMVLAHCMGDADTRMAVMLVEHRGENFPEKILYDLHFGEGDYGETGFFALLRVQLEYLDFADRFGLTPVVYWGKDLLYYDAGMDEETTNVYEYYFEQPAGIGRLEAERCRNLVRSERSQRGYFLRCATTRDSYLVEEEEIETFARLYARHIRLNDRTEKFLREELELLLAGKRTLGVHVRGTDFKQGQLNHPVIVSPKDYLEAAKELFSGGEYNQIFLATDDSEALSLFTEAFGDKLVYYADATRTQGDQGVHMQKSKRELHRYKLGLEVLRDAYALAACDGLVAGLSHVSFAARYISKALGRDYIEKVILSNGVRRAPQKKSGGGRLNRSYDGSLLAWDGGVAA